MRLGIIDLGTNSVRLFVYDLRHNRPPQKIYQSKARVRLGDNLYEDSKLDPLAIKRTVKAIKTFSKTLHEFRVSAVKAVGTSALRSATNGKKLIKAVREESGIELEPISGAREAELIGKGVTYHQPCGSGRHLLVDIGGGSTELVTVQDNKVVKAVSLELGAARCQQSFLKTVPSKSSRENKLRKHINEVLEEAFTEKERDAGFDSAIGSSGSIRAMGRIILQKEGGIPHHFDALRLTRLAEKLRPLQASELEKIPFLEPKRVDLIFSAVIILDELCTALRIPAVQTTQYALKDGILAEALEESLSQEAGAQSFA